MVEKTKQKKKNETKWAKRDRMGTKKSNSVHNKIET